MPQTHIKLNDGTTIPVVGFGAGTALYNKESSELIKTAISTGYTYLDGAQQYGNSESIGQGIKESGKKRDELFILTKFGGDNLQSDAIEPRKVLNEELKKLGTDHVDLFLIHNPFYTGDRTLAETWKILESLQKEGLTKSIGVSNFREEDILELEKVWTIKPAVNQIEYHPYVYHAPNVIRLTDLLSKHDIKVQSYGPQTPLFRVPGGPVDAIVKRIADAKNITSGQVLLQWAQQKTGGIVVTTSRDKGRQKEQLEALTKVERLSDKEVDEISEAGKGKFYRHFQHPVWNAAKP